MLAEPGSLGRATLEADRWAAYAALREHDPVHWSAEFKCWFLTRHRDVVCALRSADVFAGHPLRSSTQIFGRTALDTDGLAHRELRRMVSWFRSADVTGYGPWIDQAIEEVLAEVPPGGPVDLVAAIAHRVPARVIASVLGLPASAGEALYAALGPVFAHLDDPRSSVMTALDAHDSVTQSLADIEPAADGVIAALRRGTRQREAPAPESLSRQVILMLAAGTRTTAAAIAATLSAVIDHPDAYQRLAEPGWAAAVVAESLRWRPPLHFTLRYAAAGCTFGEREVPAGAPVQLALAAANHDGRVFPGAEEWRPARDTSHAVSFGGGRHACAGSLLAVAEVERLLMAVHRRFARLLPEAVPEETGLTFVMPRELLVTVVPR